MNNPDQLLEEFDAFSSRVCASMADNQSVLQQNRELKAEIDVVTRELTSFQKQMSIMNCEILEKYKELAGSMKKSALATKESGSTLNNQEQLIQAKYEVDILSSTKKSLDRELHLQKAENERLSRANHQLMREKMLANNNAEIDYLRLHCRELEADNSRLKRQLNMSTSSKSSSGPDAGKRPSDNRLPKSGNSRTGGYGY